jgi:hypothetical protein
MKKITLLSLFLIATNLFGQIPTPVDLGLRHLQFNFNKDKVDILVKSKKGEEQKKKPIFLFLQGSQPIPLIIVYDSIHTFPVFPFKLDSLLDNYHVAIIGKPFVPLIVAQKELTSNMNFIDPKTSEPPFGYIQRNHLDYYVGRNKAVINYLQQLPWVSKSKLVVAGHSEGSTIAAKLATVSTSVTQLIYLSGNPFGRIMSMIERSRRQESDSTSLAEDEFNYWEEIVKTPTKMDTQGDTFKATYGFSLPPFDNLIKLKIPVYIVYGTKDFSSTYNDYLRVETIRQKLSNFTFKAYIGLEHNFFPVDKNGSINYEIDGWDKVGLDIYRWLREK